MVELLAIEDRVVIDRGERVAEEGIHDGDLEGVIVQLFMVLQVGDVGLGHPIKEVPLVVVGVACPVGVHLVPRLLVDGVLAVIHEDHLRVTATLQVPQRSEKRGKASHIQVSSIIFHPFVEISL